MACKFCEQYETSKVLNKRDEQHLNIKSKLKVELVTKRYRDGYYCGSYTDKPVELIFCPVCWKKLVEE